jgi:hypothetical protein
MKNRWRTPHNVCLSDEEFKLVKVEAARQNPPIGFSTWIRETVMQTIRKNRGKEKR